MVSKKSLDFWVTNNLNVLMRGKHGIGKTAQVVETFNRHGLRWLYFSAATMDPWVDMIGVPKETIDAQGNKYLDLVRPKAFQFDEIDAIFFDELNRAPKKVRNAVMELMQFKSINGHKFHNLKIVWGAVNPLDEDKTYDVEKLDPAQEDRFQVHVDLDYAPDREFFTQKYGADNARYAIEWWNGLKDKDSVSPRRLDYALEMHRLGGNMRDILPSSSNVSKLVNVLSNGIAKDKLVSLMNEGKVAEAKAFLAKENVYAEVEEWMLEKPEAASQYFALLSNERLTKLITENYTKSKVMAGILGEFYGNEGAGIQQVCQSIQASSIGKDVKAAIFEAIPKVESNNFGTKPIKWIPSLKHNGNFATTVNNWVSANKVSGTTIDRKDIIDGMVDMPADIDAGLAKAVATILLQLVKSSYKKTISDNGKAIIGPLNFAMEKAGINILDNSYYKMHRNKFIQCGMEQFVWIPSSK